MLQGPPRAQEPAERQVRLRVERLGLVDLAKYGLLVGIVVAVVTVIAVFVGWTSFESSGGLQSLIDAISGGTTSSSLGSVTKVVNTNSVMSVALVVAALQVAGAVVLALVAGVAYNLASKLTGGLFFGFAAPARR